MLPLTTVQVPILATQVPGSANRLLGGLAVETVAATVCVTAPLLVTVNDPETTLPGPVQAKGSVTNPGVSLLTVTLKAQLAVKPALSVMEQFTVETPTGKSEPLGGTQTGWLFKGRQLSLTTGAAQFTCAVVPDVPAN